MVDDSRWTGRRTDTVLGTLFQTALTSTALTSYRHMLRVGGIDPPADLLHGVLPEVGQHTFIAVQKTCVGKGYAPLECLLVHVSGSRTNRPDALYFQTNGFADVSDLYSELPREALVFWERRKLEVRSWAKKVSVSPV